MDNFFSKDVRINPPRLGGCLLSSILVAMFLGAIGLGWLVNGTLILFGILITLPVVAWLGLSWWVKRRLVESSCPACNYEFTAFVGKECSCPSCSELLIVEKDEFKRLKSVGTIDVIAVDVIDD